MPPRWTILPAWRGATVAIVATGPSFTAAQARVIAVNDAIYPCWFADIAYACDAAWWAHHDGLPGFTGLKLSLLDGTDPRAKPCEVSGVWHIRSSGHEGFDPDRQHIRTGGNSGYQALHLALHLGAAKIVLVGFDMRDDDGQAHWFGDHPREISRTRTPALWRDRFTALADAAQHLGVTVVNASPGTALAAFQTCALEQAFG